MMSKLTISKVARRAGVGVETVRYYQRIGLITEPAKPAVGYRIYQERDITQLLFIQRAKTLGFSLSEIRNLLALGHDGCEGTQALASRKLLDIRERIADLEAIATTLETLINSCDSNRDQGECPIISAILTSDKP